MTTSVQPGEMYGPGARSLQDQFDSRRLADRLAELTLHDQLDDGDIALILYGDVPLIGVPTLQRLVAAGKA